VKQTFKKILLFLLIASSLHSSINSHAKDIDTTIKSGLSIFKTPFRSDVYLYNTITKGEPGHELKILFGEPQNSGKPLDQSTYWPETGAVITSFGPDADNRQSGITKIATLSRYSGIEAGTTYEFTQTIQLPGIDGNANSQLQLKQRIVGAGLGTKVFIGLQLPGEKQTQWFDDYQWHQKNIPRIDINGNLLGTYTISYCFYHWHKTPTKVKDDWGSFLPSASSVAKLSSLALTTFIARYIYKSKVKQIHTNLKNISRTFKRYPPSEEAATKTHTDLTDTQKSLINSLSDEELLLLKGKVSRGTEGNLMKAVRIRIFDAISKQYPEKYGKNTFNNMETALDTFSSDTQINSDERSKIYNTAYAALIKEKLLANEECAKPFPRGCFREGHFPMFSVQALDFLAKKRDLDMKMRNINIGKNALFGAMSLIVAAAAAYYAPTIHANIVYQIEYTKAIPVP